MAKKAKTGEKNLVYIVLDASGSMYPIQDATIKGVNDFVADTAETNPDARFFQSQFDTKVTMVCSGVPMRTVEPLTDRTYVPGGSTALLDAIGRAVKEIEDLPEQPDKVVVAIMTDGQENASREYTRAAVNALVEKHQDRGWQFIFMGAELDSFTEAGAIGMRNAASTSATWQRSAIGTQAAYSTLTSSVSNYFAGTSLTADMNQATYDSTLASLSGTPTGKAEAGRQVVDLRTGKPAHRAAKRSYPAQSNPEQSNPEQYSK